MSLLEDLIDQMLGPSHTSLVTCSDDKVVVQVRKDGLEQPGGLELAPEGLILDEEFDEQLVMPLAALGAGWRRLHDYLARFPAEATRGASRVTFNVRAPATGPIWAEDGLRANVVQLCYDGDELQIVKESELRLLEASSLWSEDWCARLAAFDARRAAWAERLDELEPDEACLELAKEPVDEGWEELAVQLGLEEEALRARAAPVIERVLDQHPAVRARYQELYGLKLPVGVSQLAALVAALGEMPCVPPDGWEGELPQGVGRGRLWLDHALGMRPAGLCEWFAPGGLARRTRATLALSGRPPSEEPLDPRLDMRYRCDAPQFVTFLAGDSDGLHWGLWYDSPEYFPVIAHNYARDSAETWLDGTGDVLVFLRRRLEQRIEETVHEWATADDEEARGYPLGAWRALRVVQVHLDVVEAVVRTRSSVEEPRCPWPRTDVHPVGSPALALPPGAGLVDRQTPGASHEQGAPAVDQLAHGLALARQELAAGRPATALFFGLYLHWLDLDSHREQAGQLLLDAYAALDFSAFAALLELHLLSTSGSSSRLSRPGSSLAQKFSQRRRKQFIDRATRPCRYSMNSATVPLRS